MSPSDPSPYPRSDLVDALPDLRALGEVEKARAENGPFDRKAYQREYMRAWRKRKKELAGDG